MQVYAIYIGFFKLDSDAMFGVVPKIFPFDDWRFRRFDDCCPHYYLRRIRLSLGADRTVAFLPVCI